MKFMVGMKVNDYVLLDEIKKNKESIYDVYFSWGNFANGRTNQLLSDNCAPWERQDIQRAMLEELSEAGIPLNVLFNANCYGGDSQARSFFNKIGETVDYIAGKYGLGSATTTSPLIAKFIKNNFEEIEVRASVNMEVGSIEGMEYISEYFDAYYMKREYNRDFEKIKELSGWCKANGKKLYMLANSGCLDNCSAHNFHDNLVAHEEEISARDNAYSFTGICKEYLKDERHYGALIHNTNFIRPEDIAKYEPYFDAVKLATRIHRNPKSVLKSYLEGHYSGNILTLLEPEHSIYPYVVENGEPLRLVKIDTWES